MEFKRDFSSTYGTGCLESQTIKGGTPQEREVQLAPGPPRGRSPSWLQAILEGGAKLAPGPPRGRKELAPGPPRGQLTQGSVLAQYSQS